jgi:ribosomal protein S18 acetylase RimI-like enzyme
VASALLAECIAEARRQPKCGAVYLHVKADNISALRFYEKNGFQNLRYLEGWLCVLCVVKSTT